MIHRPPLNRSALWLTSATAGLAALSLPGKSYALATGTGQSPENLAAVPSEGGRRVASYDHVLGTSLDMVLEAGDAGLASNAENAVLDEIARLNAILSTYESGSEIRQVMSGAPVRSPELAEVLALYSKWTAATRGLIDINMGGVIALWKDAARTGRIPEAAELEQARQRPFAWNIDALGKGYVIDRAVEVARRHVPAGLINIGGDIRVWGSHDWLVGVANPVRPADNAGPIATTLLRQSAIATSAGYARFAVIGGNRASHLIDPRTNRPAPWGGSATIVAGDAVSANAISTAVAVGGEEAADLPSHPGVVGSLVVTPAGGVSSSGAFSTIPVALAAAPAASESAWPANFQVSIEIKIRNFSGDTGGADEFGGFGGGFGGRRGRGGGRGGTKRPYVAVWIEDANGQLVRNLSLWASEDRYFSELSTWWNKIGRSYNAAYSVSRATRGPGTYTLAWDGRNDAGRPVPQGEYRVRVEINREHGGHAVQNAVLNCGTEPMSAELRVSPESEASTVRYGPPNL